MPIIFSDSTTQDISEHGYGYLFSFTLTETTTVSMNTDNNIPYFVLYADDSLYNYINDGYSITQSLSSGTYYFAFFLLNSEDLNPGFTCLLNIYSINAIIYTDLDYSDQILLNESKYNESDAMETTVDVVNWLADYAHGYNFNVTEYQTYKISFDVFPNNCEMIASFILLNDNLTGDIEADDIINERNNISNNFHYDFIYSADATETL